MENRSTFGKHDRPLTENERAWVEIIRLASWDSDPGLTLASVQAVRKIFQPSRPDHRSRLE